MAINHTKTLINITGCFEPNGDFVTGSLVYVHRFIDQDTGVEISSNSCAEKIASKDEFLSYINGSVQPAVSKSASVVSI